MMSAAGRGPRFRCYDSGNNGLRLPEDNREEFLQAVKPRLGDLEKRWLTDGLLRKFLGNEPMVAAPARRLRAERVPHAMLFTGPRAWGNSHWRECFAQAANCERLKDGLLRGMPHLPAHRTTS